MKAVLISIQPKWCELIASGKKTIEVRKSVPKLDTPFKCYIYCTQGKAKDLFSCGDWIYQNRMKVIGEFVCDSINEWFYLPDLHYEEYGERMYYISLEDGHTACLTYEEFENYGKGKTLYGWHISDLKIYDKPRELSEFRTVTTCGSVIAKDMLCNTCCLCSDFCTKKPKRITRPPQSWCYGEEED